MDSGKLLFQQQIPLVVELQGNVDGRDFTVHGKGFGDATSGKIETKFVCTTGDLPVPWSTLVTTITYGAQCFAKYPTNVKDFYKSCMPEGYTQDRIIRFENDGVYKTNARVTFENGSVYNRIQLTGKGFKEGGNILGKNLEFSYNPHVIYIIGDQANNGLKARFNIVHDVIGGDEVVADHTQHNRPLGGGIVIVPDYHHITVHTTMSKDNEESRDHLILNEIFKAVDCKKDYM